MHFRIEGKRENARFVPVHPKVQRLIEKYLTLEKHGWGIEFDLEGSLFRPMALNRTGLEKMGLSLRRCSSAPGRSSFR
jgi:hypothetical protein